MWPSTLCGPLRTRSTTAGANWVPLCWASYGRIGRFAGCCNEQSSAVKWLRNCGKRSGLSPEEPLPDLASVPATVWEFYTPPGTYFDLFPIHVLTTSTLQLMSRLNAEANWDVRRFRPNVLVDTESMPGAIENHWLGQAIHIGGFVIKAEIPTIRCAMPMHAQTDLQRDPSVLRTIVREANQCLGLYASVIESGGVTVGDIVELSPSDE